MEKRKLKVSMKLNVGATVDEILTFTTCYKMAKIKIQKGAFF